MKLKMKKLKWSEKQRFSIKSPVLHHWSSKTGETQSNISISFHYFSWKYSQNQKQQTLEQKHSDKGSVKVFFIIYSKFYLLMWYLWDRNKASRVLEVSLESEKGKCWAKRKREAAILPKSKKSHFYTIEVATFTSKKQKTRPDFWILFQNLG